MSATDKDAPWWVRKAREETHKWRCAGCPWCGRGAYKKEQKRKFRRETKRDTREREEEEKW